MRNRMYGFLLLGAFAGSTSATPIDNGLNANGLNANGLNANGLNANGLNANGLNANGLNANGLNANGLNANGLAARGLTREPTASNSATTHLASTPPTRASFGTTSLALLLREAGRAPLTRQP